ncbi:MAG: GAF domain-containing protein [Chloroflexi bacterium]|nr:GAF domain-containing protein [Chloroflexota bacterium]
MGLADVSLNKKIGLPVVAGLILGLGLFSWVGLQAVRTTTDNILEERLSRARILAYLLDENLSHMVFHVQNAASPISDMKSRAEFESAAGSLQDILADADIPLINIVITEKDGTVLQSWLDEDVRPGDVLPVPDPMAPGAAQGRVSNGVYLAGKQVVLITSPVIGTDGAPAGVFAAVVDVGSSAIGAFSQAGRIGQSGYAEVVDGNGTVLIRTQPSAAPARGEKSDHPQKFAELIGEGKAAVRTCHRCHEEAESIMRKRDLVAFAPLAAATWGVALRQSEEEALAPTNQLEQRLLFIGAAVLVGIILVVWIIMQSVVRPLTALTAAAQRVASGNFKAPAPGRRRDEIGRLGAAFHTMTDKLEESRVELVTRNRALAVLNSIAATASQSLNLELVLESSLQRVIEVSQASHGCVFLLSADRGHLLMKARTGRNDLFNCPDIASSGRGCACYQVLRSGQTLAVNDPGQCPLLGNTPEDPPDSFVAVPLRSRDRTLGVMNICCPEQGCFTDSEFKLLESIGFYIGLAVENSILYQEATRKEQIRGQLLERLITAQEEERKRISRELHDEHGQILTGLIMNLEKMETMISPEQAQLRSKLEKARGLVSRSLDNIRLLTFGLRPSDLDGLGLTAAISSYAEERLGAAGIALEFEAENFERCLTPAMETALFRILQEAINNVIRHAQATRVRISLGLTGGEVAATVEDNGHGFEDSAKDRHREGSLGIVGMRERAELLGGTLTITSRPGRGTRLDIRIVVPETAVSGQPGNVVEG